MEEALRGIGIMSCDYFWFWIIDKEKSVFIGIKCGKYMFYFLFQWSQFKPNDGAINIFSSLIRDQVKKVDLN